MTDETDVTTPELVEKIVRTVLFPRGYRYVAPVSCVEGPDVGKQGAWTRLWAHLHRWDYCSRTPGVVPTLVRPYRWNQASGSPLQQQALLRTNAPGTSHPQAKLSEKR